MREIEFRGKRKIDNTWIYGGYMKTARTNKIQVGGTSRFCTVYPETLGQFTGLCDKDGKKIYEGDICLCNRHIADSVDKRTFEIIFDGSWIGLSNEIYGSQIGYEEFDMCEVIGNIYDNPELLGGSDEECDN